MQTIYEYKGDPFIINLMIKPVVELVRKELAEQYDVVSEFSDNIHYTGLCDIAVNRFIDHFRNKFGNIMDESQLECNLSSIHGEQQHTSKLLSKFWVYQHTWCTLDIGDHRFYIDPTSEQFKFIYGDKIPEYYIGTTAPQWYYPDRENPNFNKPWKWLNVIRIPVYNGKRWHKMYLIEFCQYIIYGKISDLIYNRRHKKSKK